MATKEKTAGKTAKKEPKAVAPKAETPNQEAPKVEVKTIAVTKEIADQLQHQRLDIVMLVAAMRSLIGMCRDEKETKILTDHAKVCVEMSRGIAQSMIKQYDINHLETLGMTAFLAKEVAPLAFNVVHKVDEEAKKAKATPKKKGVK